MPDSATDTQRGCYSGPAGVVFTPDDILILWKYLCLNPNTENKVVREKCKQYLEGREN